MAKPVPRLTPDDIQRIIATAWDDKPPFDRVLRQHGLKLADIQAVIGGMAPMDGAKDFLDELRTRFQVIILSDTFYEFADPMMRQLGRPTLFCHKLEVAEDGTITDYKLRQPDQKTMAIKAFHSLNYRCIAAGDSYNDTGMLSEAEQGILFDAPENVIREFPQFPVTHNYEELKAEIRKASLRKIP